MSTEGARKIEYSKDGEMVFIDVKIYGEMYNAKVDIFFIDGDRYVEEITELYDKPMYMPDFTVDRVEEEYYLITGADVVDLSTGERFEGQKKTVVIAFVDELIAKEDQG